MEFLVIAALAALVLFSRKPDQAAAAKATPASNTSPTTSGAFSTVAHEDLLIDLEESTGIHASVMLAIEQHETNTFKSYLWKNANNPGGIRFTSKLHKKHITRDDAGEMARFAVFDTWQDGVRGHARVLEASRYDAARATDDPYVQVDRIKAGGYATDPKWPSKVKAHLNRILNSNGRL